MRAAFTLTGRPPDGFQPDDILSFHQRDAAMLAERVRGGLLEKGLFWNGAPALLRLSLRSGGFTARLYAAGEGGRGGRDRRSGRSGRARFSAMIRRMLGLHQDVSGFAARFADHPVMGPLIAARPQLRVPCAATPFEALTWAIAGQQISVQAALSLRRGLILAANARSPQAPDAPIAPIAPVAPAAPGGEREDGRGVEPSGGQEGAPYCHPDAAAVAALGPDALGRAGFSRSKTRALLAVCEGVLSSALDLDDWEEMAADDPVGGAFNPAAVREALLTIPGIGPWTADYVLLRGFGHLDGSLHGDAAVRRGLRGLLGAKDKLTQEETRRWLETFSPYRALAAAHLWAAQSRAGY